MTWLKTMSWQSFLIHLSRKKVSACSYQSISHDTLEGIQDSLGFWIPDSRGTEFQILGQWNLDSRHFQSLMGFCPYSLSCNVDCLLPATMFCLLLLFRTHLCCWTWCCRALFSKKRRQKILEFQELQFDRGNLLSILCLIYVSFNFMSIIIMLIITTHIYY